MSFGPSGLSVIARGPYYRGVRKERFDCSKLAKFSLRRDFYMQWLSRLPMLHSSGFARVCENEHVGPS